MTFTVTVFISTITIVNIVLLPFYLNTYNMKTLISLIFLKRSLVFPILLFSSISLHWLLRKAFLSLLAILWKSAFKWVYFFVSPLPLASLLFIATCKPPQTIILPFCISFSWEWSDPCAKSGTWMSNYRFHFSV